MGVSVLDWHTCFFWIKLKKFSVKLPFIQTETNKFNCWTKLKIMLSLNINKALY